MIVRTVLHATSLATFLGGCASEYEMNKRSRYKRLDPPCSYGEFVWAPPIYGCEGQQYSPKRTEPQIEVDPNDVRLRPVPAVV